MTGMATSAQLRWRYVAQLQSLRPRADTERQGLPGLPRQGSVTKRLSCPAQRHVMSGTLQEVTAAIFFNFFSCDAGQPVLHGRGAVPDARFSGPTLLEMSG